VRIKKRRDELPASVDEDVTVACEDATINCRYCPLAARPTTESPIHQPVVVVLDVEINLDQDRCIIH